MLFFGVKPIHLHSYFRKKISTGCINFTSSLEL